MGRPPKRQNTALYKIQARITESELQALEKTKRMLNMESRSDFIRFALSYYIQQQQGD